MIDYDALLNQIVDSQKKTADNVYSKNMLKTDTIGNTIIGRLIPNLNDRDHTIVKYFHHGWKSVSKQGFNLFFLCPSTVGERCPICTQSIKMWKSGNPHLVEQSKLIRRRENKLINFYVISDLKEPKNNGTLKILRYGMQIETKIKMATEGVDKAIYGKRVFRLDEEGCNFRIMCEQNSQKKDAWPTYTNSGFLPPSKIDGMTEEKQKEILASVFDLTKQFELKSYSEIESELQKHFLIDESLRINSSGRAESSPEIPTTNNTPIPQAPAGNHEVHTPPPPQSTDSQQPTEDEIDKMLAELQKGKK